jgi:hypothetical protein
MKPPSESLPVKRALTTTFVLSLVVAVLMIVASLAGLLYPSVLYPSDELVHSFVVNDVVNLVIGLPILFISMWLTRRGKMLGLLFWPGALLYNLYNYIAYLVGTPLSVFTFAYLLHVLLSAYIIYELVRTIDAESVGAQLTGRVPRKFSSWVLILFGISFIFRSIGMIAQGFTDQVILPISEMGVLIADLVLSVLCIGGGALLLRRRPLGYTSGLGLLFAVSMLFIGLILILILQPILTDANFIFTDVIVVFVMGLVCFIPFGLYVRGALSKGKPSQSS